MRRTSLAVAAALIAVGLTPVAEASHRPNGYCSPSGDVCLSTAKVNGVRKLQISLAAKYFSRYELCVAAPNGSKTCKLFRIEARDNGTFGDSVRWARQFPDEGDGAYNVVWRRLSGDRIGRRLGFHAP